MKLRLNLILISLTVLNKLILSLKRMDREFIWKIQVMEQKEEYILV